MRRGRKNRLRGGPGRIAGAFRAIAAFEPVSADGSLCFPGNGICRPENEAPKFPSGRRSAVSETKAVVKNAASSGQFASAPGNLPKRRTAWWAREDSNLQPDRYERTCEGQWKGRLLSDLQGFCFCPTRFGQRNDQRLLRPLMAPNGFCGAPHVRRVMVSVCLLDQRRGYSEEASSFP